MARTLVRKTEKIIKEESVYSKINKLETSISALVSTTNRINETLLFTLMQK